MRAIPAGSAIKVRITGSKRPRTPRDIPSAQKTIGPVKFAASHQNPAAIALDQRPPAIASNLVGNQRTQIAADRSRRRQPQQLECALRREISAERHDQFGRQRDARGLDRHEQRDAGIAGRGDYFADEDEKDSKNFFSHEQEAVPSCSSQFSGKTRASSLRTENRELNLFQCNGYSQRRAPLERAFLGKRVSRKVAPSGLLVTFTRTVGASGAVIPAGRSMAYCENTSL